MADLPAPLPSVLGPLVDDLRKTLGAGLVGAYLYGSAVAGDFEPSASDLDVVVVTATPVDELPRATLQGVIDRLIAAEPDWADRLDLAFIDRHTLATFRSGGALLSISHDEPLSRYDRADEWLETWFLVRSADTPLAGPPPGELIPAIEPSEFLAAVVGETAARIARLNGVARPGPLAYLVLTLGRTIHSLATLSPCSKLDGSRAIIGRHPAARPVVEECLAVWRSRGRTAFSRAAMAKLPELIETLHADIRSACGGMTAGRETD